MNDDFKNILYATSILIGALIVMPFIAGYERLRDWLSGGRH